MPARFSLPLRITSAYLLSGFPVFSSAIREIMAQSGHQIAPVNALCTRQRSHETVLSGGADYLTTTHVNVGIIRMIELIVLGEVFAATKASAASHQNAPRAGHSVCRSERFLTNGDRNLRRCIPVGSPAGKPG